MHPRPQRGKTGCAVLPLPVYLEAAAPGRPVENRRTGAAGLQGSVRTVEVRGPMGTQVQASYGLLPAGLVKSLVGHSQDMDT